MEDETEEDVNRNWRSRYGHQRNDKGTGRFGYKRASGDYPNYNNF